MTALMNVLVVEDNDIDVEHITRCMARSQLPNTVHHALDGEQALNQLRGSAGADPLDRPYLVLLDLNMPRMNGIEFLEELRSEPDLADTPVMVLTTSDREEDIAQSMQLGALDYLTKPITSEQLAKIIVASDAKQQGRIVDERTYSVAVINEDPGFTTVVRDSSLATGWSFRFFESAHDALTRLRGRLPDVVVVDQHVRGSDGVRLIEELRALPDSEGTRFYLSSSSAVPVGEAQRANTLGVSILDNVVLTDRDRLLAFLEAEDSA